MVAFLRSFGGVTKAVLALPLHAPNGSNFAQLARVALKAASERLFNSSISFEDVFVNNHAEESDQSVCWVRSSFLCNIDGVIVPRRATSQTLIRQTEFRKRGIAAIYTYVERVFANQSRVFPMFVSLRVYSKFFSPDISDSDSSLPALFEGK